MKIEDIEDVLRAGAPRSGRRAGPAGRPARASLSIAALYRSLGAPCGVSREALVVSHVYGIIFHGASSLLTYLLTSFDKIFL